MLSKIVLTKLLIILTLFLVASFSCDCDNGDENTAPQVNIIQPMDGDIFDEGDSIAFECDAYDAEDGNLGGESVIWTSTVNGEFGSGTALVAVLNSGSHIIRAFATDSEDKSAYASIDILVLSPTAPEITITSPREGQRFSIGDEIDFRCRATDTEDGILSGESIVWISNIAGEIGTDTSFTLTFDESGTHTIRVVATDSDNNANWAEVSLEVADVEELIPVGYLTTGGDAHDIDVEGDIAYLAAYDAGLFTIDVSDPTNPVELGNFRTADGFAVQVDAQDNFIYMSDYHYFRILDAHDPSNLIQVDEFREIVERIDSLPESGFYCEVYVEDTLVYLSLNSGYDDVYYEDFKYQVNISDPLDAQYNYFHPLDTFYNTHYETIRSYYSSNDFLYATVTRGNSRSLLILMLPGQELVYSIISWADVNFNDIDIKNNNAYITTYEDGIWVFNVSIPENIQLISTNLAGIRHINLDIQGNYAYVACGWDGLKVIEITNPENLEIVAEYRSTDYVREIKVDGDYAYIADGYNGLVILDISAFN